MLTIEFRGSIIVSTSPSTQDRSNIITTKKHEPVFNSGEKCCYTLSPRGIPLLTTRLISTHLSRNLFESYRRYSPKYNRFTNWVNPVALVQSIWRVARSFLSNFLPRCPRCHRLPSNSIQFFFLKPKLIYYAFIEYF